MSKNLRKGEEMSEVLCWNRRRYMHSSLTKLKKLQGKKKWLWLRDRSIKRETESLIMVAQEQAIKTNKKAKNRQDSN